MNDKEMNNSNVYPGVANPTKANDQTRIDPVENNFVSGGYEKVVLSS